jgi:esterase/lipase
MDYTRKNARSIEMPVLAVQATDDTHLSARGLKFIRKVARHKDTEIHLLKEGTHVITRGCAKSQVCDLVTKFVERNAGGVRLAVVPEGATALTSDPS